MSQIDLAKASIYLVIATPATLNIKEQKILIITANSKYGCEDTCYK